MSNENESRSSPRKAGLTPKLRMELVEKAAQYRRQAKADLQDSPKVQHWREKDRQRQEDPEAYNAKRRDDYAMLIAETEGREVRGYKHLADLTAEEKARHKRQQARERKRKSRAAKKAAQA